MASAGSLTLDLQLQSAQFLAGLRQVQANTARSAAAISGAFDTMKAAGAAFTGAIAVDALAGLIQNAFDYADAIQDLSDRTGAGAEMLQKFRYAAQMTGAGFETADAALEKFSNQLGKAANGNDQMVKKFANLGVTANNVDKALVQAMEGISKLPTAQQRAAATTELFGKKAQALTMLMEGGSKEFERFGEAAEDAGIILGGDLIANAGKVNDQLDTMKMIMNAQMASAIVKNADAIQSMAQGVTSLVSAMVKFWAQDPSKALGLMGALGGGAAGAALGGPLGALGGAALGGIGGVIAGRKAKDISYANDREWRKWKSIEDTTTKKAADLVAYGMAHPLSGTGKSNAAERLNAHARNAREKRLAREKKFQDGTASIYSNLTGPGTDDSAGGSLPTTAVKTNKTKSSSTKSDAEIAADWQRDFLRARSDLYSSQSGASTDFREKAELAAQKLRNGYFQNTNDIDSDTGTDAEIREGKKKYSEAQAKILKGVEKEIYDLEYDTIMRDRDEEIAKQRLEIASAALANDNDLLSVHSSLARSSKERRDNALKQLDNGFKLERLQLDAIVASKTATDAEKKIAEARLKMLPGLQALATEGVKQSTAGPLESYLNVIPRTGDEVNEAMQNVATNGLDALESGLLDVIKGAETFGDVMGGVLDNILDGILKIGLQQMIIKPLAGALFGGGSGGGGGIFGSLLGAIGVKGARANGGYTGAGNYLVGERGPEIVSIGTNANVIPHRAIANAANDNRRGGMTFNFGSITSNDPDAVKAMATQALFEAMPMITNQASLATMGRLNRPTTG